MAKKYYGEIVLQGMCWDVERMLREKQDPKLILKCIKKKVLFLDNPKWHKIIWWEHNQVLKNDNYLNCLPDCDDKVLIKDGILEE